MQQIIRTMRVLLKKNKKFNQLLLVFKKRLARLKYDKWWKQNYQLDTEKLKQQQLIKHVNTPLISIVIPVYNPSKEHLQEMLDSILNQSYSNWEICIADGGSRVEIIELLTQYQKNDVQIKVKFLGSNLHICGNSNHAITLAKGEYIALLDHDDLLSPQCLFEFVTVINQHNYPDFIYSDESFYYNGRLIEGHLKPDFSPDSLREMNYITHLIMFKSELLKKIGQVVFREEFQGAQDYDLILRLTEVAQSVIHIKIPLYHWRMHKNSSLGNPNSKNYAYKNGCLAIEDHLKRVGKKATVTARDNLLGIYKVNYELLKPLPLVSIIIPNKDSKNLLEKCINSILENTTYQNYEIVIIENNSITSEIFAFYSQISNARIRIINYDEKGFNYSRINNFGINYTEGEYIVFLNNDTEVISNNWIEELLMYGQFPEIGAVGAKLLFADQTIQHAGIVIGKNSLAGNLFDSLPDNYVAQFARTHRVQNLLAVTGACMLVSKSKFLEVGGFDEKLVVAFNDVDLCLKLYSVGYRNVFNPDAKLYHYESKTRGYENNPQKQTRFMMEHQYFKQKWGENYVDPYYPRIYSSYNYSF